MRESLCIVFLVTLIVAVGLTTAKLKEGECEVCIKFLKKLETQFTDEDRKNPETMTNKLKKACRKAKGKENRFCYYIGGTDDAATYIVNDVIRPMGYYLTPEKICEKLKQKDAQICELQYDKQIDWKNVNLKKMRVKELKRILNEWDETCEGCLEKSDYVKKIQSVMNRHVEL